MDIYDMSSVFNEAQVFVQGITEMLRDNPDLPATELEAGSAVSQICLKSKWLHIRQSGQSLPWINFGQAVQSQFGSVLDSMSLGWLSTFEN